MAAEIPRPVKYLVRSAFVGGLLLVGALAAGCRHEARTAAPELPSVPSYQKAVEEFQGRQGAPKPDEQDAKVMQDAADQLRQAMPRPGLKVGQKAPDFTLADAFGRPVTLSRELRHGPVVLAFYRGAWCPYCNMELHALQQTLPTIKHYGAELIAVTPQKPDWSRDQIQKDGYAFPILSDLDDSVMKAYQLFFNVPQPLSALYIHRFGFDLAKYNGPGRYVLPVPGTFVIDQDGVIRAAFADTDYKKRMEPADIVAALKDIREGR